MRKENKRVRKEPDAVKKALHEYCKEVIKRFKPACIILYGSRARLYKGKDSWHIPAAATG